MKKEIYEAKKAAKRALKPSWVDLQQKPKPRPSVEPNPRFKPLSAYVGRPHTRDLDNKKSSRARRERRANAAAEFVANL